MSAPTELLSLQASRPISAIEILEAYEKEEVMNKSVPRVMAVEDYISLPSSDSIAETSDTDWLWFALGSTIGLFVSLA